MSLSCATCLRSPEIGARMEKNTRHLKILYTAAKLLRKQEYILERLKASAHNTIQPIFGLPDEVLSNILEVVIPSRHDSWSWNPMKGKDTNWTVQEFKGVLRAQAVTATCSRFREPILRTPRCWTFVECVLSHGGTRLENCQDNACAEQKLSI